MDYYLFQGKPKIAVTYESDQALRPVNFFITNCLPPAAKKWIEYEKWELWEVRAMKSAVLLLSDSNRAKLQIVASLFMPPRPFLRGKVPGLDIGKIL